MRGLGQKQSDADRDKQKIEGDQCPHPGKQALYVDHDPSPLKGYQCGAYLERPNAFR
jgi:hypothetical protein